MATTWQPPEVEESVDSWVPPEAAETPAWTPPEPQASAEWMPPEAEDEVFGPRQGVFETAGQGLMGSPGQYVMGAVGGAAKVLDQGAELVEKYTGLQRGGLFGDVADVTDEIVEESQRVFPTDPRNPRAAAVGSGAGQGLTILGTAAMGAAVGLGKAAMTQVPLWMGAASGGGEGIDAAKELGIDSPEKALAMGVLFGAVEAGTERLGGIGGKKATDALMSRYRQSAGEVLKNATKAIGSEAVEEVIATSAQDLLKRAFADQDPNNPGFTKNGVKLPALDAELAERLELSAIGGAAGGSVFAGVQALNNRTLPRQGDALPAQPTDQPGPEPMASELNPTVVVEGQSMTYDPNALNQEQVRTLGATGNLQPYIDQGLVTPEVVQTEQQAEWTPPPEDVVVNDAVTPENAGAVEVDLFGEPIVEESALDSVLDQLETTEVPVESLTLSRDVPQFKSDANQSTGVVEPLAGKYQRLGTGPILVWERMDGRQEVISGRHRFDLARRTGEATIPAQVVREADGFTQQMAQTADAEVNIRDGQGKVKDYANYFRNAEITDAEAESRGLRARAAGRTGWIIGTQASPAVFDLHANQILTDAAAEGIARTAPGNEALQQIGARSIIDGQPIDVSINLMRAMQSEFAGTPTASQLDLFGANDSAMQAMRQQARRATAIQRDLREQMAAVQGAAKRPEKAREMGVDVQDPEAVRQRVREIKAELDRWESWPLHEDLRAQVRGEILPAAETELQAIVEDQISLTQARSKEGMEGFYWTEANARKAAKIPAKVWESSALDTSIRVALEVSPDHPVSPEVQGAARQGLLDLEAAWGIQWSTASVAQLRELTGKEKFDGLYVSQAYGDNPVIYIRNTPEARSIVWHEMAHFADHRRLGQKGFFASQINKNAPMKALMDFLGTTQSGKNLESAKTLIKKPKATLNKNQKQLLYFADPAEQFARAVEFATAYILGLPTPNYGADQGIVSFTNTELDAIISYVDSIFAHLRKPELVRPARTSAGAIPDGMPARDGGTTAGLGQTQVQSDRPTSQESESGNAPPVGKASLRRGLNTGTTMSAREPTMAEAMNGQIRESQFGERVQADERLTPEMRAAPITDFAVQSQQEAMDVANSLIRENGLEGAMALFRTDASLPKPIRLAGLMQVALQYDAQAALARRQNNDEGSANADRLTEQAIEAKADLEFMGNEAGRNLAMFNAWARMSPDGQLRRFGKRLDDQVRKRVEREIGVSIDEIRSMTDEVTRSITVEELLDDVFSETESPRPVGRDGRRIGESFLSRVLGSAQTVLEKVANSAALERTLQAVDTALKALGGKLFSDPLLLTPFGRAVLMTTRTLIMQGQKLAQAVAASIADVRTRLNDPSISDAAMAQAVVGAVTKEMLRPVLQKLAFDPAYTEAMAVKDLTEIGLSAQESAKLAQAVVSRRPKIAKALQDKIRQQLLRRMANKPKAKARAAKLPKVLDILTKAVGAGVATERQFVEAFAKAFEMPRMTAEQRAKLQDMARRVNLLPEGALRNAKAIELLNEMAMIEGIAAVDVVLAAWYANILAGLGTQAVNIWGNATHLLRTLASTGFNPRDMATVLGGMVAGLPSGMREARAMWREGVAHKTLKWDDQQKAGALELMMQQGGPKTPAQFAAYIMSLGGLTRYVFRAMGAMDAIFWNTAQEGHAHLAVSRVLKNQGLKPGTTAFNAAFIQALGGDAAQWQTDLDQARDEIKAAGEPVTQQSVNRRAWELRQLRRGLEIGTEANRFADRLVFQNEPEGVGIFVSKMISVLQNFRPLGVPVLIPVVPFNRIIANVFESAVDFTGLGIMRGVLGRHITAGKDGRQFSELERRERIFAGMMGLTAALTALAMAIRYADDDDDEVPFMVYGMGPPDKNKREQMPKGWRPFTVKLGNTYVSLAETPMGPMLGAVGGYMDTMRYGNGDNKGMTERFALASMAGLKSFQSLGALSSVKDTMDILSGEVAGKSLKKLPLKPVPGFVPAQGLMRDISRVFDPNVISDEDVWGALFRDVPVLKSEGLPKLNILGETLRHEGIPIVNRFVTPQRKEDVWSFMGRNRLYVPSLPNVIEIGKYTSANGSNNIGLGLTALENGVMTVQQRHEFTRRQGELIKERLDAMRKEPNLAAPSPEQTERLQKRLEAITTAARKRAMLDLVGKLRGGVVK
jgi:hypothetical protein